MRTIVLLDVIWIVLLFIKGCFQQVWITNDWCSLKTSPRVQRNLEMFTLHMHAQPPLEGDVLKCHLVPLVQSKERSELHVRTTRFKANPRMSSWWPTLKWKIKLLDHINNIFLARAPMNSPWEIFCLWAQIFKDNNASKITLEFTCNPYLGAGSQEWTYLSYFKSSRKSSRRHYLLPSSLPPYFTFSLSFFLICFLPSTKMLWVPRRNTVLMRWPSFCHKEQIMK
jgi:hypothetical protein